MIDKDESKALLNDAALCTNIHKSGGKPILASTKQHKQTIVTSYYVTVLFTAKIPFDLPSESESGFTMNPNSDLIIEYPARR